MTGAFDGIRLIDFTDALAGRLCTMLLADLHAEVIRVESPANAKAGPDPAQLALDRNKRRVLLDLDGPVDRARVHALVQTADVVVFDREEALVARGLDSQSLLAANPQLVHVTLPHYGFPGPWSHLPADDVLLWGLSGAAFGQFAWEDVPIQLVTPQLRYAHGMLAANAVASALVERARSGRGQAVNVSGLHGFMAIAGTPRTSEPPARVGRGSRGSGAAYKLYECADGEWLFLATLLPHHFLMALDALDKSDIMRWEGVDGVFANIMKPGIARNVRKALEERFREKPRAKWLRILDEADVPSGPVGNRASWFASETVAANDMCESLEHPALGSVRIPGVAPKLSASPARVRHLLETVKLEEVLRPASTPEATPQPEPRKGPLDGIRVLDLGVIIAAPVASKILANFGADVIKVEPVVGDSFRGYALLFSGFNHGKRSVVVDLKTRAGRDAFFALVRSADVVCDNYRVGVLERLGIDHATLAAVNPRIVTASVTAFGTKGPLANKPGFDPLLQAMSGQMDAQGGGGEPVFHQIAINDVATAMVTAFAVSAALHQREHTGKGQHIDTSLAAQSVLIQACELVDYHGRPPAVTGGRDCLGLSATQRFFACTDGWITVSCTKGDQVAALGRVLGRQLDRDAHQAPWDAPVAAGLVDAIKGHAREALLAQLHAAGVPAATVTELAEMHEHPLHVANRLYEGWQHPDHGPIQCVRSYADFSRTQGGFVRHAPALGAHTAEVFAESGVDAATLDAWIRKGAVR